MMLFSRATACLILVLASATASSQDVVARCNFDREGWKEQGSVSLAPDGRVTGFSWLFKHRTLGFCSIQAATFNVIGEGVYQGTGGCKVMSWRQGARLTLAVSPENDACQAYCSTRSAYEQLLPIVFSGDGRGCSY
jgi:hypothetical protein